MRIRSGFRHATASLFLCLLIAPANVSLAEDLLVSGDFSALISVPYTGYFLGEVHAPRLRDPMN